MLLRIRNRIAAFLTTGSSPGALAWSATIGILLGIFPVLGITTLLMTALSFRYRLNLALMLGVSYAVYPLQFLLIVPFIRLGELLFDAPPLPLSPDLLWAGLTENTLETLSGLGWANAYAVAGWAAVAAPISWLLKNGLHFLFTRWIR